MSDVAVQVKRARAVRLLGGETLLSFALLLTLAALVLLPLGYLAFGALSSAPPHAPDAILTWNNLAAVYASGKFIEPLLTTLGIGIATGFVSTVIGLLLVWILVRFVVPGARVWRVLLTVPLYFSPLMLAFAFVALGSPRVGLINHAWQAIGEVGSIVNVYSFVGIVFVLSVHYVPYALLVLAGPVEAIGSELEEAALVLGSSRPQVARFIVLPLLRPALISTFMIIAAMAAENFAVPTLLGRSAHIKTIPGEIYYLVSAEPTSPNLAAALGSLLLLIACAGVLGYRWMARASDRYVAVTGKPKRRVRTDPGTWRLVLPVLLGAYLSVTTVLPLAALIYGSFLPFLGRRVNLDLLTLRNYASALQPANVQALTNSLLLASIAATICVVLGFLVSFCVWRTRAPLRSALDYLSSVSVAIPGMVLGIGMLWTYVGAPFGLWGSIWILLLAYVARFVVHPTRAASTGLLQMSRDLDEAGRVLGASLPRRMLDISAPIVRVPLLSSWLVVAIFAFNEVTSTVLLYSSRSLTLSILTWNSLNSVGAMQAFAFAVLQGLITAVLVTCVYFLSGRERE
ncbi:iron ABC transporter permease [Bradyrhizobium sp. KB893862 SZCCT0404]|uniref:ABC transporter permease n=1 Tax=Bradyrhizobium sp. KB893862 SZCCT0404 TaxID=2807672 RepID=UPI001BA61881|nr:iron ABC transporter permease [Bradyrhizobium sp. KB893862 SZCCT0404]MBR1175321.1 iron ABC transporter permease [Bradyrhizobium sp. KB893862 SZCCT0404]